MLNKDLITLQKGNKYILCNPINGQWIKLTSDTYEVIKELYKSNMNIEKLLEDMYDEEDRTYITQIINYLKKYNMLNDNINTNLKVITFSITKRCNLKCLHCSENAHEIKDEEQLSYNDICSILDKIFAYYPDSIVITGGEPLVRADFIDIIEYIKASYTGSLNLMTNGTLINEKNVKKIVSYFDSIDMSLDGFDEKSCEKIRGKTVFSKVTASIKLLQKYGYNKISLSMVKTKDTFQYVEEFNKLNEKLGTRPVIRRFAPDGRGGENIEQLADLNDHDLLFNLTDVKEKVKVVNSSSESNILVHKCVIMNGQLYVGNDGYVYPCPALALPEFKLLHMNEILDLGTFIENQIYKVANGYKNYLDILPENDAQCKDCDVRLFCCGCPLYPYLYKKFNILDRYCKYRKAVLEKAIWGN